MTYDKPERILASKIINFTKIRNIFISYDRVRKRILWFSGSVMVYFIFRRFLCIEIYKTPNNLNPSLMKEIFERGMKIELLETDICWIGIFLGETKLRLVLKFFNFNLFIVDVLLFYNNSYILRKYANLGQLIHYLKIT